jgi:PAS domain S-box-containing protein
VTEYGPSRTGDVEFRVGLLSEHGIGNAWTRTTDVVVVAEAPSGRILFSSAVSARVIEHRLAELAEEEEFQIFHPDGEVYAPSEWPLVRSIAAGEVIVDEEFFGVVAGGRLSYRVSSYPLYDGAGRIVAAVSVARDVTTRERVAEQLAYHASLLENVEDAVVGTDPEFRLTVWNRGAERLYGFTGEEVLGRPAREVASYAGDQSRLEMERELVETDRTRTEITAYRKDRSPVEVELISVAVRDEDGAVSGYLGIHREITEQKRAKEERDRRAFQQALVAALGLRALAGEEVNSVMDEAVAMVARGLDLTRVAIAELLPDGRELRLRAGVGWREGAIGMARGPAGRDSLVGYTVMVGEPVVSEDVSADPRFELSEFLATYAPTSAATVVIPGRDEPFGVLGVFSRQRRSFSEDDVSFLQGVANVISTAVERVASEARIIKVRDAERRRIARDLHDEALQDLTDALAQASTDGDGFGDAAMRLARVVPALERAGQQVRGAIYDLGLSGEEHRPFPELLEELVELHQAMAVGCRIELDVRAGVTATSLGRVGTEVLRVIGESLVNARRHSGAQIVRVSAWGARELLCLEVSDDGRGFQMAPQPSATGGMGIRGMRERISLLGGVLNLRSAPGAGTTVRFSVPLGQHNEALDQRARVLLVEDHAAVREAIAGMFERDAGFDVVRQAASLSEARHMLEDIDVAVVDLGLPDGYGGDLIKELRDVNPRAQALVLSASLDRRDTARAIESGAAGTLSKTASLDEIVDAVHRLRAGETLLPWEEIVELLRDAVRQRDREHVDRRAIELLSPREREVLKALAEGLDSQAIADRLHITLRTERNHVTNILAKLGVHSQLQAVLFGLRYGIVEIN